LTIDTGSAPEEVKALLLRGLANRLPAFLANLINDR
jgi:hypothetical protein